MGTLQVVSFGFNAATNAMFIKVNGAPIASGNLGGALPSIPGSILATLGGGSPPGSFPLNGQIYEVLASKNAPSDALFTAIYNQIQTNLAANALAAAAPAGLLTSPSVGFADSQWFMDNGLGLGQNGTDGVGAFGESDITSRRYYYVYIPWVSGNPGGDFTFADVEPFPSSGYLDQNSFADGSSSLLPTSDAARALYAALQPATAAGVQFEIDIGTIPVLAQSGTGIGP
jgi:hypothetical protein